MSYDDGIFGSFNDWVKDTYKRGGFVEPKDEDQIPDRDRRVANRIRVNSFILGRLKRQ